MAFKRGERVRIKCQGRTLAAEIVIASANGASLMLSFDALLDGHVGMMPVLLDDKGVYHSIVTGVAIEIRPEV